MRGFSPLKDILKGLLRTYGIDAQILEISRNWKDIVGDDLIDHAWPKKIKNSILFVQTENPIWRSEVKLRRRKMLENIAKVFNEKIIIDIRCI